MAGTIDGWHLLIVPELYAYVGGLSDNPDLKDYRGVGLARAFIGKKDLPSLMYTGMIGEHWEHVTTQLDLTIPVRIRYMDFETFFLIQYFNGYGESLLSYREHSSTVRAGIQLVR
jgi:outer membrane phospholipase A